MPKLCLCRIIYFALFSPFQFQISSIPKLCLWRRLLPSSPPTSHRHHPSSPPPSQVGLSLTSSRALAGDFQFVSLQPHHQIRFAALSIESDNLSSPEPSDQPRLTSSIGSAPFLQPLQSVIITPAHIRLLTFCACAAAISKTWQFFSTIPTLLGLKRSASSLEKLMDAMEDEVPETMAAVRQSGMEIIDLTAEFSELGQDVTEGVKRSTRAPATSAAEAKPLAQAQNALANGDVKSKPEI